MHLLLQAKRYGFVFPVLSLAVVRVLSLADVRCRRPRRAAWRRITSRGTACASGVCSSCSRRGPPGPPPITRSPLCTWKRCETSQANMWGGRGLKILNFALSKFALLSVVIASCLLRVFRPRQHVADYPDLEAVRRALPAPTLRQS